MSWGIFDYLFPWTTLPSRVPPVGLSAHQEQQRRPRSFSFTKQHFSFPLLPLGLSHLVTLWFNSSPFPLLFEVRHSLDALLDAFLPLLVSDKFLDKLVTEMARLWEMMLPWFSGVINSLSLEMKNEESLGSWKGHLAHLLDEKKSMDLDY